ncbi:hypothetical protein Taro_023950 [Colocasia esculenta]|uniref:Uncharacterized protein n=1 Tax=Colocasia esculenta TaxID=4460 RepID=A0A843UYW2_COLES|nr:hypothetical protein [Colocasia esculenta]
MASAPTACNVQHVTKASSDELLRKFADTEPAKDSPKKKTPMMLGPLARRKRPPSRRMPRAARECGCGGDGPGAERLAELKALLQHPPSRRAALLRRIGAAGARSELSAREIAGVGFLLAALQKTWRMTVEGASRMLVEKHCNRHVRLISDMV